MTVKELYNLCANNHWEDKELVIVSNNDSIIEDYVELTFSNVVTVSDFYHCDDSLKPDTRVTLII